MRIESQDFEAYAVAKPFNEAIAETWSDAFSGVLRASGQPTERLRVLDYGCGDGKYYRRFIAIGLSPENLHGVDVSRRRIERCRALGWREARFVANGEPLPYADAEFDVVNCMEVLEHIPRDQVDGVLHEIRRVLKPGGTLLGSTPNYPIKRFYDWYDAVIHRKWTRLRDDPTHVTFYTHQRLQQLLGPHFHKVDLRCFKSGFLYRRLKRTAFLMHKILFVCHKGSVA